MATAKEGGRCCLIGIDENESSGSAFEFYVSQIYRAGDKVVLVHVIPPHVWSVNHWMVQTNLEAIREQGMMDEKEKVARLQETYQTMMKVNGIPGQINVIYYVRDAGKVLCKIAAEEDCAMIVVGTRRAHTPETDSLGDIVDYVLKKSHCPIIIARNVIAEQTNKNVPRISIQYPQTFMETSTQSFRCDSNKLGVELKSRKVSCPAMQMSPPSYAELSDASTDAYTEKPMKTRRHSSIINPFRQLTFFNGFKRRPSSTKE